MPQDWISLLDGLEEAVAILDVTGTIRRDNAAMRDLIGLGAAGSSVGVSFGAIIHDPLDMPALEVLAASPKRFWSGNAMLRRSDDTTRMAKCRVEPLRDEAGTARGFAVVIQEVTDGRTHAERLRMFELAVAQSLEPVLITEAEPIDAPGPRIVYANEAFTRVTGYTLEEVVGKTPRILQGPKSDRHELDRVREALSHWKPVRAELLNYRKDGTEFWVELVIFPVADENGWYTHWVAVQRDVTHRKILELSLRAAKDEAERANLAKTAFVANMSHEIRTPLTAILGYSEMILNPELARNQHDESVHAIQRNGRHLLEIVGNVLDLSRIEAGKFQIELHPCSPIRLAEEVVATQSLVAREKGIALTFEADTSVPETCMSDSSSVRQILTNLVSNALKFTAENGHVKVRVLADRADEAQGIVVIEYEVIDDGIGIEESQIGRLFEPFEQADNTTSRKYGGTGLGLNICRLLVDLLGGSISAKSVPGQGSRFAVRIPCHFALDRPADGGSHEGRPKTLQDRSFRAKSPRFEGRILVVDDSSDNRKIISFFLKPTGLQVDMAENGREAIEKAFAQEYVAIFMDMQMPEVDGYTAAAELRRLGYGRPIIALTAHALSVDRNRCLAAGCTDYLAKPVSMSDLNAMLLRHLKPLDEPTA